MSRSLLLVSMLAACTVKVTDEFSGCASSNSMVPSKSEKLPRTFVTRWRTWKRASEWALSTAKVRVAVAVAVAVLMMGLLIVIDWLIID